MHRDRGFDCHCEEIENITNLVVEPHTIVSCFCHKNPTFPRNCWFTLQRVWSLLQIRNERDKQLIKGEISKSYYIVHNLTITLKISFNAKQIWK